MNNFNNVEINKEYFGRIIGQYKNIYRVIVQDHELLGRVSGKIHFDSEGSWDFPVVGDFVKIDRDNNSGGDGLIYEVLPRSSLVKRAMPGSSHEYQPIAANVDKVMICVSLDRDFNLNRLERYIAVAWDSRSVPVVVLTKSDLCDCVAEKVTAVNNVAIGIDVVITSSNKVDGHVSLLSCLKQSETVVFVGSSGAGKSSLINRLMNADSLKVGDLDRNSKGRHTTTRRDLMFLSNGTAVIDTPGMREIGVESTDISSVYEDIDSLALGCRFNDCTHTNEPGCAVRNSVERGLLSEKRLNNYFKLVKESGYDGLNSKQIEKEKVKNMFKDFGGMKNAKKYVKSKLIGDSNQ